MSELAFNSNGDTFDVPATVTGWRVRRMKPRGAPELVYGRDGRPLTVPVEADVEDLREAVVTPGKYRLDPINDDGKCVEGVPPAYVQVVKPDRIVDTGTAIAASGTTDDAIREAMRLNTELAKSVIDRFPEMMTAAAELLRAADGAGLPRRERRDTDEDEDDESGEDTAVPASPGFEFINNLVAQVIPIVITSLSGKKMPKLAAVLDWRKASAEGQPKQNPALDVTTATEASTAADKGDALPPLDPKTMSHFLAIQSALAPNEAALARQVAAELAPVELRAWFDELAAMPVSAAVAKIRAMLGASTKTGGAS